MTPRSLRIWVCIAVAGLMGTNMVAARNGRENAPTHAPRGATATASSNDACSNGPPLVIGIVPRFPQPDQVKRSDSNYFGCMMAQTFVALNWPADISGDAGRGVALSPTDAAVFGGEASPRVWETWRQDWETYGAAAGTPWNGYGSDILPCDVLEAPDGGVSTVTPEMWPSAFQSLGGTALDKVNLMGDDDVSTITGFKVAGPLFDSNGNLYGAQTRFNQPIFDCVATGTGSGCLTLQDGSKRFPDGLDGSPGSIAVKAIWRPAGESDEADAFYSRDMLVVSNEPAADGSINRVCRKRTMLLEGMHIVYKTPFLCAGNDAGVCDPWVWATFERTNSESNCTDGGPGYSYQPEPIGCGNLPNTGTPVELCRARPIQFFTVNNSFFPKLPSPWNRFQLVAAQWSTAGVPSPGPAANLELEAYAQQSSCMGCHNPASGTDFLWSLMMGPREGWAKPCSADANPSRNDDTPPALPAGLPTAQEK